MNKTKYEDTEVGQIPIDWRLSNIQDLFIKNEKIKIGPFGSQLKKEYLLPAGDYYVYGQENVYKKDFDICYRFLTRERFLRLKTCELKPGDFVVSTMGTIGKCAFVPESINTGIMDSHLVRMRFNEDVYKPFIEFLFESPFVQDQINKLSVGGIMDGLSTSIIKQLSIVLPKPEEQKKIANILIDTDKLILSLNAALSKKRNIRKGIIRELLTGSKRLPGYIDPWVKKNLGKSATIKARIGWQGLTTNEYLDVGEYYLITGTDFYDGGIAWNGCHYVSKERFDQDSYIKIQEQDVLVTKDGTIGKVAYLDSLPGPGTLNSGVFVIRTKEKKITQRYLAKVFISKYFDDFIDSIVAGSTIIHLYQKDIVKFDFYVPPTTDEQDAICDIIEDMDNEIRSLSKKLEKYTMLKDGMMQQLLTGKIRLI